MLDLESAFAARPRSRELFGALLALAGQLGPVQVRVGRSELALTLEDRGFAQDLDAEVLAWMSRAARPEPPPSRQ